MKQPGVIIIMKLFLLELIFIGMTEGYNMSLNYLVRNKRDIAPDILKIKYRNDKSVELVVLEKVVNRNLASSLIPIVDIEMDSEESSVYYLHHFKPIFYHGINSFAAITYFPHTNTLHGTIDQKFYIEDLPLSSADKPELVVDFIHPIVSNTNRLNRRTKRMNPKRKSNEKSESSLSKKFKEDNQISNDRHNYENPENILYPEILLAVDVSSRVEIGSLHKHEKVIMYVLSYWNAVDMLFRHLKRTTIKLNIAGILVGKTENVVNAIADSRNFRTDPVSGRILISETNAVNSLGYYFHNHNEIPRDSIDFSIWMTRATLTDEDGIYHERYISGIAAPPAACGGMHEDEENISGKISNRAVIVHDDKYSNYQTAARELAHIMFVYDDDVEVLHGCIESNCLSTNKNIPSSGIMDPANEQIEGSLMWSYCSEIHFEKYSKSKSSCCLLNYPYRTMGPPDQRKFTTIESQCKCYGLSGDGLSYYDRNFCQLPLKCKTEHGFLEAVGLPLDGTPCFNHIQSYCIRNVCVE